MRNFITKSLSLLAGTVLAWSMVAAASVIEKSSERTFPYPKMTGTVKETPKQRILEPKTKTDTRTTGIRRGVKAAVTAAPKAETMGEALGNIDLRGSVIASDTPSSEFPRGMYKLPNGQNSGFELLRSGVLANKGGAPVDGIYYAVTSISMFGETWVEIDSYNAETWESVPYLIEPETSVMASDVTVDPVSGKVYGCFYNDAFDGGYVFGTIDYKSAIRTAICDIPAEIGFYNGIAADTDGKIYAIDIHGKFYSLDKNTGKPEFIGETGVIPQYTASATIDPASGRMFWTYSTDSEGALYELDKSSGKATRLYTFPAGEEVTGLYVASAPAASGAPSSPEMLETMFERGSLSGKIKFIVPSFLFDGTPAQGGVSYKIAANGEQIAEGSAKYGDLVAADISLKKSGEYEFSIILTNESGSSPASKISAYIGYGIPATPKVSISYSDGKFAIEWEVASTGSATAPADPAEFTYTVTRYPGGTIIAENFAGNAMEDAVDEPDQMTVFYYTVTTHNHDVSSAEGKSPAWTLGAVEPPYSQDFMSADALTGFAILDNNGDGTVWKRSLFGGNVSLSYNEMLPADDWLITPPLRLKGGAMYKLSFAVSSDDRFAERLEVKMGKAPVASELTIQILGPTIYKTTETVTEEMYITPTDDGNYYIGFHGISDPDRYTLYLHNIDISGAMSGEAPDIVTELTSEPQADGSLGTTIKFIAPVTNISGKPLESIEYIEIMRDGISIGWIETPEPGSAQQISDKVEAAGIYTYTATAFNSAGKGKPATCTTYIGINKPGKPSDLKASRTVNPGEIKLTWRAPESDKDGYPINPELISYSIVEFVGNDNVTIAENIKDTEYTYQAISPETEQEFKQWAVYAKTDAGISGEIVTDLIAVGTPYVMPYSESAPEGLLSHILGTSNDPYVVWDTTTDSPDVASQDGDNGYFYMVGYFKGDEASIFTGLIHIDDTKPTLSFYVYRLTGEDPSVVDENEVDVLISADGEQKLVKTVKNSDLPLPAAWNRVVVPLDNYIGKDIELTLTGRVNNMQNIAIDNIRVDQRRDYNLAIEDISAPVETPVNKKFDISVITVNTGENDIAAYRIELLKNDDKIDEVECGPIAAGVKQKYSFSHIPDILSPESNIFAVKIIAEKDEESKDNEKTVDVAIKLPNYPMPGSLSGLKNNGVTKLTWTAPDFSATIEEKRTEDFEDGVSFAHEFADWTFIDKDRFPVGGFDGLTLPGIVKGQTKASFFVFDNTDLHQSFNSASGSKFLAVLYPDNNEKADDWAISPKLPGKAQTITLKARSYNSKYPEKFEILYSTDNTEPDNFISLCNFDNVPVAWTEYSVDLPENAAYFAIRYNAAELFMLMIDDVEYIAAVDANSFDLIGYNVYRNNVKLNESPVSSTTYTDSETTDTNTQYAVTAVYSVGESAPTWTTVETSGIKNNTISKPEIYAIGNTIFISGAENLMAIISTPDGKIIFSDICNGITTIDVAPGIYIVKAGEQTSKIIIK